MSRWGAALVFVAFVGALGGLVHQNRCDLGPHSPVEIVDILAIEIACENYAVDHCGTWPIALAQLVAPRSGERPYLAGGTVPRDAWGREYLYAPPVTAHDRPRIWSFGRDGLPDGTSDDADVGEMNAR